MYATGFKGYLLIGKGLGLVKKTAQETQCPHKVIPVNTCVLSRVSWPAGPGMNGQHHEMSSLILDNFLHMYSHQRAGSTGVLVKYGEW